MHFSKYLPLILLTLIQCKSTKNSDKIANYVHPLIGGHGHTYPGATVPFGMVQLGPDNGTQGWDWSSGYHYSDSVIRGFSHTHLSGTGIGDMLDISVMPYTGLIPDTSIIRSKFSHLQEEAHPGYYSVFLQDFKVKAEFTTTERCGFHQYT
jgi:putative alpha-1,2-mannosidase